MGADVAIELLLGVLEQGHVDGKACPALIKHDLVDVERPLGAADDGIGAAMLGDTPGCGLAGTCGRPIRLHQLDPPPQHLVYLLVFDRLEIGAVHPGEFAVRLAQPDRQGRAVEDGAQPPHLPAQLAPVEGHLEGLLALAGQRPQLQGGKPAGGATVGLEQVARQALDGEVERLALLAQVCQRRRQEGGGLLLHPALELNQGPLILRHLRGAAHVAPHPFGLSFLAAPDDEQIRLGGQRGFGFVEQALELADAPLRHAQPRHDPAQRYERPEHHEDGEERGDEHDRPLDAPDVGEDLSRPRGPARSRRAGR